MSRYIGQFRLSSGDKMLYFYEDGPYKDVLLFLKELTNSEPKYLRSVRAWAVPLLKLNKKLLLQLIEEKGWTCEIVP